MMRWRARFRHVACAALAVIAMVGVMSAWAERERLYSNRKTTGDHPGGIEGQVVSPKMPIVQVLAIPPDEPRLVYEGTISGPAGRNFKFTNLPMRKYDLMIIFENRFYEGLQLVRDTDTLTHADRRKIKYIIDKSDPFFHNKIIHRMEGTTGRGNEARCLVTQNRDSEPLRRTYKLFMLKDVGPGWQVVRSRDLYPVTTTLDLMNPRHYHAELLSDIRVTSTIRDMGNLTLSGD